MNKVDKIESLISEIIEIEKNSIQERFNSGDGKGEKYSATKADTDVVNKILSLLGEGKKGKKK